MYVICNCMHTQVREPVEPHRVPIEDAEDMTHEPAPAVQDNGKWQDLKW